MNNNYIDNTIEVIIKAFEDKKMGSTEQYKNIKKIKDKRSKGKTYE